MSYWLFKSVNTSRPLSGDQARYSWRLRSKLIATVPAIVDRIFKAVSDEVAANPRLMQELFRLNYERKTARYEEGYYSPFLDRFGAYKNACMDF
ncbi:unnamed protein product [Gongylonema pulchrum]|uniref:Peptidase_M13_N domain-containing protein n=1 Tax=Gongylonema pulchrum TaxID=637853 RepID=A0A183DGX3_9BILA|nr:unnamed protein product [Gongylonema pulchrum]